MSKSPEIKPGDKLKMKNNTYEVVSVLGDGGFGTVFKGKIAKNSSEVAMKFFKTQAFTSPVNAECIGSGNPSYPKSNLVIKVAIWSSMKLTKDKSDRSNPKFFIILGFVKGTTLKSWFNDNLRAPEDQRISIDDMAKKIFLPLSEYMTFCHSQGIVHRDFTFNNIMICTGCSTK